VGRRAVSALWLALVLIGAAGSSPAPGAGPRLLLPDLEQASPGMIQGATVAGATGPRFRLGFASAVDNVGVGPLLVVARRGSRSDARMIATQIVRRSDGSTATYARVGIVRYVHSETHRHWHLLAFDRYELRRANGYALVRPDRKTGFCLGDRYETSRSVDLPGEPPKAIWTEECGKSRPGLLTVREGISVGYGDDYKPTLEGQYFDITRLRPERYLIVHRVNVDRRLRESDYSNNASSLLFDLRWPNGFSRDPRIDVLRRCPNSALCTA
jgi:lysyl oxidase